MMEILYLGQLVAQRRRVGTLILPIYLYIEGSVEERQSQSNNAIPTLHRNLPILLLYTCQV